MRQFLHLNVFEWLGLIGFVGLVAYAGYATYSMPRAKTYVHIHSETAQYEWDIQCPADSGCKTWKLIKGAREAKVDDGTRRHGPGNVITFRNADGSWPEPKR
jgi:hypothetical protein